MWSSSLVIEKHVLKTFLDSFNLLYLLHFSHNRHSLLSIFRNTAAVSLIPLLEVRLMEIKPNDNDSVEFLVVFKSLFQTQEEVVARGKVETLWKVVKKSPSKIIESPS